MFARWITSSMAKFTIAKPCYSQRHEARLEGPTFPPFPGPIFRCLRSRFSCFTDRFQPNLFPSSLSLSLAFSLGFNIVSRPLEFHSDSNDLVKKYTHCFGKESFTLTLTLKSSIVRKFSLKNF